MALGRDVGLPTGAELDALFEVLRQHAYTREINDAEPAPRDGLGADGDAIKIEIDETAIVVRAATRRLTNTRSEAFSDAEALSDALLASGPWIAYRGGQIGLHPARRYTPTMPTEEIAGWFGIVELILVHRSD